MTDGVAVSIIFDLISEKDEITFYNTDQPVERDNKKYHILKGLDPGLNLPSGGIKRKMYKKFNINLIDSPIKIRTNSFRVFTQDSKRKSIFTTLVVMKKIL